MKIEECMIDGEIYYKVFGFDGTYEELMKIIDEYKMNQLKTFSIEMAKKGIDIEQLFKDLQPMFDITKQISDLSLKNYNYLKGIKK